MAAPRLILLIIASLLAVVSRPYSADAASLNVLASDPAAEAIINGRHAGYLIRFDGPVDHATSRLQITRSGRVIRLLVPRLDSAVDVLYATSQAPAPGHYLLHWEARSIDGEVSKGDIPFTVGPS